MRTPPPGWRTSVAIGSSLVEPLLGPVDLTAGTGPMPEWVIIGAETGNRKEKVAPDYEWVRKIVSDCKTFGVPVFMKDSMKGIWPGNLLTEFPGTTPARSATTQSTFLGQSSAWYVERPSP